MSGSRQRSSKSDKASDLVGDLTRISVLNTSELRSLLWATTGKSPSPQLSGGLLRRLVAYRIQETTLGGLEPRLAKSLDRLAAGGAPPTRLKPGSVLVREHNGIRHRVMVVPEGFAWHDKVLPSLSAVAKAITGTTWNGNRFFGLPTRKTATEPSGELREKGKVANVRLPAALE